MTALAIIAGIVLPCLTVFGIAAWLAPLGHQDADGFHYGEPDELDDPENWGGQ